EATSQTVSSAAAGMVVRMPEDLRLAITNAEGADAYPISGIVYMLVYMEQGDAVKGKALADFLWWEINDGEQYVIDLHYAPLPAQLVERSGAKINSLMHGGKPLRANSN